MPGAEMDADREERRMGGATWRGTGSARTPVPVPGQPGHAGFPWPPREPLKLGEPDAAPPTLTDIARMIADLSQRLGEVEREVQTTRLTLQRLAAGGR